MTATTRTTGGRVSERGDAVQGGEGRAAPHKLSGIIANVAVEVVHLVSCLQPLLEHTKGGVDDACVR